MERPFAIETAPESRGCNPSSLGRSSAPKDKHGRSVGDEGAPAGRHDAHAPSGPGEPPGSVF